MSDGRVIVITDQPYFDDPAARHVVSVGDAEIARECSFFRTPRKGQRARWENLGGEGPGRYFFRETILAHRRTVQHDAEAQAVPEIRHASFAAFLAAIGYDWRSNSYRPAALAA